MKLKSLPFLYFILVICTLIACKKTVGLPSEPQNKILEYKVTNIQDTVIYGAIDEVEKSITVYVPYYYNVAVIDPEIKLSAGAKLQYQPEAVEVERSDVVYQVKAANGAVTSYKLYIVLQQAAKLILNENSTSNVIAVYYPNNPIVLRGNFFTTNPEAANAYLVSKKDSKEVSINYGLAAIGKSLDANNQVLYSLNYQTLLPTIDSGLYQVKLKLFGQTAVSQYPIRISYKQPDFSTLGRELKQGESFSYNVVPGNVFTAVKSVALSDEHGIFRTLILESYTRTQLNIKVPEDFPIGNYLQMRVEFDTWNPVTKSISSFIVKSK